MQLTIYYVFLPTPALSAAAHTAGHEWLLEPDIWFDIEHDRVGREHPQEQVEAAAWTVFLAKLATDGPESDGDRLFRTECLRLGFTGCWRVYVAKAADPVANLLLDAEKNVDLARQILSS